MIRSPYITIYPRGAAGGTYYAVVFDGYNKSRPFSLKVKDRRAAEEWRDEELERLRAVARGEAISYTKTTMTFDEAWTEYEKLPAVATKSRRTIKHELTCYRMFQEWCEARGCHTIEAVTTSLIKEYRRSIQRERSITITSVNNYVNNIKPVWAYLVQEDVFGGDNPFRLIQSLKAGRKEPKSRSWEEVQEVLSVAKKEDTDVALFLILGAYLGMRRLEILRAKWEHIDWTNRRITIHKTKPRPMEYTVNLYPELIRELLPYRALGGYIVRPGATEWDEATGLRWSYYNPLRSVFASVNRQRSKEERIQPFSGHQLRHTLITHLRSLGWSLGDIAAFVCQNETAITEKYGEAGPELRRASLNISLQQQSY